jgi:hypothetical protein
VPFDVGRLEGRENEHFLDSIEVDRILGAASMTLWCRMDE